MSQSQPPALARRRWTCRKRSENVGNVGRSDIGKILVPNRSLGPVDQGRRPFPHARSVTSLEPQASLVRDIPMRQIATCAT
jgi:hypothetical protein